MSKPTKADARITISCCAHMLEALGLRVGDVRSLDITIGGTKRLFKRATVKLQTEPCDCEERDE